MKRLLSYVGIAFFAVFIIEGCGPSEEDLRQRESARRDSLERVRVQRLQAARLDSLARAHMMVAQAEVEKEGRKRAIQFDPNGRFSVQVGSSRSNVKAERIAAEWRGKGFENAYVTRFGEEDSGEVWYRVRLGRVRTLQDARALLEMVQKDHNAEGWIDSARGDS